MEVNQKGNMVQVVFEKGGLEIYVVTDRIIRFFSQMQNSCPASKAVEEDRCAGVAFTVQKLPQGVAVTTDSLVVKVYDDGYTDIFDSRGTALCLDYRGEKSIQKMYEWDAQLMEQEGHTAGQGEEEHLIQVRRQMDGDECFYGLGDKTGFLNKRGYAYCNWNTDNPDPHVDSFQSLYKSIPFFIVKKKQAVYGVFFDNTYRAWFDFGKESDSYYWFGADDGNLDCYFIGGQDMKEVLKGYTYLTGTAPLPQMWTLGYHQSRWGYRCEEDIRQIAENMRKNNLPCDAIHMDIDYMDHYKVFTVDKNRFPDLKGMTEELAKMGIRIVTIMDPGVKAEKGYSVYEEGVQKEYFAVSPDGSIYENVVWPGESVYPDFGREEVRSWWGENYKVLTDAGVSGIWTDMNEPASFKGELPDDVVFYDEKRKSSHAEQHNLYGHNMARATYNGLKKLTGKRPFVITRACYSGTQKYSTAWTGDNHSIWAHLQMAVPQMCNMGLSGMPYIGTDIGGFGSDTTRELLCRWIQVGCFSPLCRNHSAAGTRVQEPWTWDERTLEIYRKYLKLRYMLLPYYYDLCRAEEETGIPMLRPLVLNYENDENVKNLNGQFMLGDSLLIAPVVEQGMTQKLVYLPEGGWYDLWTGEKTEGGRYIIRGAELDVCPVYVKEGSILPLYPPRLSVSEKKDDALLLAVYPGDGKCGYLHYQDNGEDFKYRDGEYNLYHFSVEEGKLCTEMLREGYEKKYRKIELCGEQLFKNIV